MSPASLLLGFVRDRDAAMWKGFLFAALLFLLSCLQSLLQHQYLYRCFTVGMRLKTAVMGLIYRKVTTATTMQQCYVLRSAHQTSCTAPFTRCAATHVNKQTNTRWQR